MERKRTEGMRIVKIVSMPLVIMWRFVVWFPYRWWYYRYKWRYTIPEAKVKQFFIYMKRIALRFKCEINIQIDSRFDVFFYWFVVNTLLKEGYRYLKKNHAIEESVSNEACQLFRGVVLIFISQGNELRAMFAELQYTDVNAFLAHPLDLFKECRGNIYNDTAEDFVRLVLSASADAIVAMKVSYEYAVKKVRERANLDSERMKRFCELIEFAHKIIDVIEESPTALCEAMAMHSEILARWALAFMDYQAAHAATTASQSMRMVRSRIRNRKFNSRYHTALDEYFRNVRSAGGALYNHLIAPPQLPAPPECLPPTRQRAEEQRKMDEMDEKLKNMEKDNAPMRQTMKETKQKIKDAVVGGAEQADPDGDTIGPRPEKTGNRAADLAAEKNYCRALAKKLIGSRKVSRVHNYPTARDYILRCTNGEPFYGDCKYVRTIIDRHDWMASTLLTIIRGGGQSNPKPNYQKQTKAARRRRQLAKDWEGVGLSPPDVLS